jgi:hypothetical protein
VKKPPINTQIQTSQKVKSKRKIERKKAPRFEISISRFREIERKFFSLLVELAAMFNSIWNYFGINAAEETGFLFMRIVIRMSQRIDEGWVGLGDSAVSESGCAEGLSDSVEGLTL